MEFIDHDDFISCHDWDGFNGYDDVFIGSIKLNSEDGYYWFHPARGRIPLTCRHLRSLTEKISELNKAT